MKSTRQIFIVLILLFTISAGINAQQKTKATSAKAKTKPALMKTHLSVDKEMSNKITLDDVKAWADFTPLQVVGTDKKTYALQQFTVTIITMNPLQTQEFGNGNAGIPFLARKAMDSLKQGDTVFLKEVTAKTEAASDIPIANIVFSVKE